MKWTFALTLGVSLGATALVVGCADAPKIGSQQRSTVSSTLATYKATAETTKKYGIATWRLRHVGDGSVLEGLDAKGKSVSHVSLAVRKNKKSEAAMLWFSGGDSRKGFMKGGKEGLAKNTLPGSMPSWATAARRDLLKHAESGRTPYGCADDLFGIFSGLLQQAPSCAKTDTLQTCISKLLQAQGGSNGLANVSKLLTSCKPATNSGSSSSGGTASNSSGSSSGSSGKTSSSSSSGSSGTTSSSGATSSSSGDASTPDDAGSSGSSGSSGDAGTKKGLTEGCASDAECASNVCYLGDTNAYCSLKCTSANAATVCVAPFNGVCNNKGFCRKP